MGKEKHNNEMPSRLVGGALVFGGWWVAGGAASDSHITIPGIGGKWTED